MEERGTPGSPGAAVSRGFIFAEQAVRGCPKRGMGEECMAVFNRDAVECRELVRIDRREVGSILRRHRKAIGVSAEDVGIECEPEMEGADIRAYESGTRGAGPERRLRIVQALIRLGAEIPTGELLALGLRWRRR